MKNLIVFCLLIFSLQLSAQIYQPNWESLDKRPTPEWFRDSKFGIFIHWGVYAVPGWSTKGSYAEWYQQGLQTTDTARQKFHKAKFGNRTYYDLANDFKAELFNPGDWAKLFERSGAKYIVLTSKHHDGFTLWPNEHANKTWGFKWNAVDIGPKRDLLGDLFKAVRKTTVRAGMYYSLYEWFNPLWKSDPKKFASDHVWPQMKELINNYQPDVFWTDGDWDAPAETWKSREFLTWLYNESPVKEKIVVNDRWGSGVRFNHGGIFTPEYQPDLDFENHDWEESRGMGYSYGYNREEDAWDYNSTQSLVIALIDKVSRGGNFLLDIGPDEHGKIPPIMQDRLLQIGEWLNINGEAIYNTRRWKIPFQWSAGRRDYKGGNEHITGDWKTGGDIMLKLTVDPDPGYAVKEVFYTYNPTTNNLYIIFPKYPDNKKIVLKDVILPSGTRISFLSTKENLQWKQADQNLEISLPEYDPNRIRSPFAYALKIEDFGRFASKPKIKVEYKPGELKPTISMTANTNEIIVYTIDGTDPAKKAVAYTGPFSIDKTSQLRAFTNLSGLQGKDPNALSSSEATQEVKVYEWKKAQKHSKPKQGINFKYFEPTGKVNLNSTSGPPTASGVADIISNKEKKRTDKFAFEFTGYIKIAKDGIYTFFTDSDDGSMLYIDGEELVNNDGDHGNVEKSGKAALKKGFHLIRVLYFDSGGGNSLKVSMQPEGGRKEIIPASSLFH
ncbi:MAG TPA: alpha-L-fucosidase [Chitinophagaceae bacterium]|nr:alpha-L-fucosidase [Chitinophagaceae bacterium]